MVEAVSRPSEEDKEAHLRENNLILYRMPEVSTDDINKRIEGDRIFSVSLCSKELEVDLCDDVMARKMMTAPQTIAEKAKK